MNDDHTTDSHLGGIPVHVSLRDELAVILHELLCDGRHDDSDAPCWTAWHIEADILMPPIRRALAAAWEDGALDGSRGLLPYVERARRNPYRGGAT